MQIFQISYVVKVTSHCTCKHVPIMLVNDCNQRLVVGGYVGMLVLTKYVVYFYAKEMQSTYIVT